LCEKKLERKINELEPLFAKIRNLAEKYENFSKKGNKRTGKRSCHYSIHLIRNSNFAKKTFSKYSSDIVTLRKAGNKIH
jgi:hypothetical protein